MLFIKLMLGWMFCSVVLCVVLHKLHVGRE